MLLLALALAFIQLHSSLGAPACGSQAEQYPSENGTLYLACPAGQAVATVDFAAFGTPYGSCTDGWHYNASCNSSSAGPAVEDLCLGAVGCAIPVDRNVLGDACVGVPKVLAVSLSCGPVVQPKVPVRSVVWGITSIPLLAAQVHRNPLQDVRVNVTFVLQNSHSPGPRATTLVRPAFWDGGGSWIVRFAPPAAGTWAWKSASTAVSDTGLAGAQGSLVVDAACPANASCDYPGVVVPGAPFRTRGHVRVSESRRHFEHGADGSPFFWLGDTHWQMPDWEHLSDCNAPDSNCSSQFRYLLQSRAQLGFTVYQTYFKGDEPHWWLDAGPVTDRALLDATEEGWAWLSPSRFREVADPMMNAVSEAGLLLALGIGLHHMSEEMPTERLARLGEYVVARYGAHPIVWITAQEVNSPSSNVTAWERVAYAMAMADAPGHASPLSAHMWPFVSEQNHTNPYIWGDQPWHTWFATQGGHTGLGIRTQSHYEGYWNYTPTQPFLEAEAMYEDIICGPRFAHANDTRRAAYKAMQCGSLGYTYGAAAVWLFKWNQTDPRGAKYNPDPMWWWPGMHLEGAGQMGILRRFYDGGLQLEAGATRGQRPASRASYAAASWTDLVPQFASSSVCGALSDPEETPVSATADLGTVVLYAYGASQELGSLQGLQENATYGGEWIDVRSGNRSDAWPSSPSHGGVVSSAGRLQLPVKPTAADDWLLLLVRQGS